MKVTISYPSFRSLTPNPHNKELIDIECQENITQDLDQEHIPILNRRNLSDSVHKLHIRYPSFRPVTLYPHHREQIEVECEVKNLPSKNAQEAPVYSYNKRKDEEYIPFLPMNTRLSTVKDPAPKVSVSYPNFCTLTSNPLNSEQIYVEIDVKNLAQNEDLNQNNRKSKSRVLSAIKEDPSPINSICYKSRKQINIGGEVTNNINAVDVFAPCVYSYQKRKELDDKQYIPPFKRRKLSTILEDSETVNQLILEGEPIFKIVADYDEKTKMFCQEGHKMDLIGLLAKLSTDTDTDESIEKMLTVDYDESILKVDDNQTIVDKLRTLPFFKDHKTLVRACTVSDWDSLDRGDPDLPEGFKVKEKIRRSGARAGKVDKEFINPDMTVVFRSKVAVAEYVKIVNTMRAEN